MKFDYHPCFPFLSLFLSLFFFPVATIILVPLRGVYPYFLKPYSHTPQLVPSSQLCFQCFISRAQSTPSLPSHLSIFSFYVTWLTLFFRSAPLFLFPFFRFMQIPPGNPPLHLPSPLLLFISSPSSSAPCPHACFFRYNSSLLFPLPLAPVRDAPSTLFALSIPLSLSLFLALPPCNLSLSLPTPGQSNTRLDPLFVALTARNQYIPLSAVPSIRDHQPFPAESYSWSWPSIENSPSNFFLLSFFSFSFVFDLVSFFFFFFLLFVIFFSFYYSLSLVWAVRFPLHSATSADPAL